MDYCAAREEASNLNLPVAVNVKLSFRFNMKVWWNTEINVGSLNFGYHCFTFRSQFYILPEPTMIVSIWLLFES